MQKLNSIAVRKDTPASFKNITDQGSQLYRKVGINHSHKIVREIER